MQKGEPSYASKTVKIAYQETLDCYRPTVTVLISNYYCPTSPQIF
jgi:hypothetical protein